MRKMPVQTPFRQTDYTLNINKIDYLSLDYWVTWEICYYSNNTINSSVKILNNTPSGCSQPSTGIKMVVRVAGWLESVCFDTYVG